MQPDPSPSSPGLRVRVERLLLPIAAALAVFGGFALVALSAVTVYSIIGRALPDLPLLAWWRPVRGNFELVEMVTAIAIFSCLPYTQLRRGNVLVDFFTQRAGPRAKATFAIFANSLFAVIALLFTWRMIIGAEEMLTASFTQTTMLLRIPIWYAYLPSTIFMIFLSVVTLFTVWRSVDEALGDGEPLPE